MKEKIQRFSKGNFVYDNPSICLSEYELKITAEAGKITEGSFTISNSSNKKMMGSVYSSDSHMKLLDSKFNENLNVIRYVFDGTYLKAGDCIKGCFDIVSDCGESSLFYTINVEPACIQTPTGKVMDLEQLAALARMDWAEAKKVFRSEDFERIFLNREQGFKYRYLIKTVSTSQALEEFLITFNKKDAILLEIDKTSLEYRVGKEDIVDKLVLTKTGWGYAEIRVSCDAPFIQLEQKYLWADRFIGNKHQINFSIDKQQLKKGKNYGHIYIKTPLQTMTVNVICRNRVDKASDGKLYIKTLARLTKNYLSFRQNRIEMREYIEKAYAALKSLSAAGNDYIRDLLRLHLAIMLGRSDVALCLLEQLSDEALTMKKRSQLEYCIYLYLNAIYKKTEEAVVKAAEEIRSIYMNENHDWRILWLLLCTDNRYNSKALMLADIKEQFIAGCRSPILYYEAVCCFNEEPSLLRELNSFEIQVINYGAKYDILSLELLRQFTYLANKKKSFDPVIFQSLEGLYNKHKSEDILSAICCMLIKGLKKSEKYFKWFRLAVLSQLKITGLYEYYMYSITDPYEDAIDRPVMLYFIYNSNLNEHKMALLYANIIKNKADNESIFRSYYKRMEVFTRKMLERHLINDNLAVIYREFIGRNIPDEELISHLPYVMFKNKISCFNPNIVSVTILHKEMEAEETVPLVEGQALIDIYSENYEIFFNDSFGNRYVSSVSYELKPYLNPEDYVEYCIEGSNNPMLLLFVYDKYLKECEHTEGTIEIIERILELEGLTKSFQSQCHKILVKYYNDINNDKRLENYFDKMDLSLLPYEERISHIELMINRSYYDRALKAIEAFGYRQLPLYMLIKLCSGFLHTYGQDEKNPVLLSLCYYLFKQNKYDDIILAYLVKFYRGSTETMLNLWQAADRFEIDTHRLEERLLSQMLFCENHVDDSFIIFYGYYKSVSNRLLVRAFLSYHAYRYLVHNENIDAGIFPIMRRELLYEENEVCLLAWLKKNASESNLSKNDLIFAEYSIEQMVRKGIILPFFLEYKDKLNLPDRLMGKHYITYISNPENQVFIHYLINGAGNEYITERMPNIFMGIHMKELILFYNDEVSYYISEESSEGIKRTEEFHIRYDCKVTDEATRYNQINKMLLAMEEKDECELFDLMKAYVKNEYMTGACFRQI